MSKPSMILGTALLLFLAALIYLVASSLSRRVAPTFEPTPMGFQAGGVERIAGITDTLTIDARDERRWNFVDLDTGRLLPFPDTLGWDIAIRRYNIKSAIAMADAGRARYDTLASVPDSRYIESTAGPDSAGPENHRWYHYSILSHLLEPNGHIFVARTSEGRQFKLEVISYYCPGLVAGCMTFRFGRLL